MPVAPFLRAGPDKRGMMLYVLAALALQALYFSAAYHREFILRFALCLLAGWAIEFVYRWLQDGRVAWPTAGAGVTSGLLAFTLPAILPFRILFYGLVVALVFGKFMAQPQALRLNPMLLGRLFLMLMFPDALRVWQDPALPIDALSVATPLGLYLSEKAIYAPAQLVLGQVRGDWGDGIYAMLPGSPGDLLPPLTLALGAVLFWRGVLDWRPGLAYILAFAAGCLLLKLPMPFSLVSGATAFTAVYIVTDPRTSPASRAGRWMFGALAGGLNAGVRWWGYYPEGVALAVLAANLLTPALDRLAFWGCSWRLRHRAARAMSGSS